MKNLPIGIQTFRDFSGQGYIYVDKTKQIHDLFARGGQYYFFFRPRRFGKSLLISTLAELFAGNKELFKGLWIYDKIQWTRHPIIRIDSSTFDYETPERLEASLLKFLGDTARSYGVTLTRDSSCKGGFVELIEKLSGQGKVVILVDDYDKPVTHYMEKNEIEKAVAVRDILKDFYSIIKSSDAHLCFALITGVSNCSQASAFSGLNNFTDITVSDDFSTLLGFTETELRHYFAPYLERLAGDRGISEEQLIEQINDYYNGYSWDGKSFVYNPFSILNMLQEGMLKNYWFSAGVPTFLTRLARKQQFELMVLENVPVRNYNLDIYDVEKIETLPLLFQNGFLTIKRTTTRDLVSTYHLSYPNREVRDSFLNHLLGEYTQNPLSSVGQTLELIKQAIDADDIERFIQEIQSLMNSIPYYLFIDAQDTYYYSILYLALRLSGAEILGGQYFYIDRLDAALETENKIYIMEFKMGSEQDALTQIKKRKYYEKYLGNGKDIVLMGIGLDSQNRNVGGYLVENL
jgi:hypothetical protein